MAMRGWVTLAALAGAVAALASIGAGPAAQRSATPRAVTTPRAVDDHEPVNVLSPALEPFDGVAGGWAPSPR